MASIFEFTLKGVRTFRGRDWDGVQGSIYYKGKKVGWYNDSGDGGAADIDFEGTIEERRKMDELLNKALFSLLILCVFTSFRWALSVVYGIL